MSAFVADVLTNMFAQLLWTIPLGVFLWIRERRKRVQARRQRERYRAAWWAALEAIQRTRPDLRGDALRVELDGWMAAYDRGEWSP